MKMIWNIECNRTPTLGELMIGPTDVLPHKRIISEQFMGASSSRQMPVPNTNSDHSEISQREENQIKIKLVLTWWIPSSMPGSPADGWIFNKFVFWSPKPSGCPPDIRISGRRIPPYSEWGGVSPGCILWRGSSL